MFVFIISTTSTEDTRMSSSETFGLVYSTVNTTNFGNLLFHLPAEEKTLVRKLEKCLYKINAAETCFFIFL